MKTFQVSGILLICLYILHNHGYEAKASRRHPGRHDHDKNRNVVPQRDHPNADGLVKNYVAVAKLKGYIIKKQKKATSRIIKNLTAFSAEDKLEYSFFPKSSGIVQFKVRAANDVLISLSCSAAVRDPLYEVFIGGWSNASSVIPKNRTEADVAEATTPGILNGDEFKGFWVRWNNGTISAGNEGKSIPFLRYTDSERLMIEYVAVRTGWGASGSWIIGQPQGGCSEGTEGMCWVAAKDGNVPPGAFQGGEENGEPMFIIRANHSGGLIPGKLLSSDGTSYVPFSRGALAVPSYEVLCYFSGSWQQWSGHDVPSNAVVAGKSENGEPLYVGRIKLGDSYIVGKVHPSHGVCYIPSGGREIASANYEILVS